MGERSDHLREKDFQALHEDVFVPDESFEWAKEMIIFGKKSSNRRMKMFCAGSRL
jgi:hypothetical protein